jgi:hypothetical protein
MILIDEACVGEAPRQLGPRDGDVAVDSRLQAAHECFNVAIDEGGIGADRFQRTGHDPFRMRPPRRRKVVLERAPCGLIFIPVAHELVEATAVQSSGQAALMVGEVTKKRDAGWVKRRL